MMSYPEVDNTPFLLSYINDIRRWQACMKRHREEEEASSEKEKIVQDFRIQRMFKRRYSEQRPLYETGLYLIVDGGYPKWKCLQCPLKHSSLPKVKLWSGWVESVRKDIECVFGILKGRFRCLKLPIYYHSKDAVDNMFFVCCILHNMLLCNDGLDRRWEKDVNWCGQAGEHSLDDQNVFKKHLKRTAINIDKDTDFSLKGVAAVRNSYEIFHETNVVELNRSHHTLKDNLVTHYSEEYYDKKVDWLK